MSSKVDHIVEAMRTLLAHETSFPVDVNKALEEGFFEGPPDNRILGPTQPRGEPCGIFFSNGREIAAVGDVARIDMAFSTAKSYLSLIAGIALHEGKLRTLDDEVYRSVDHPSLMHSHNRPISWRHLLQQTSEWTGEIWGKCDVIDHNREIGPSGHGVLKGQPRALKVPGTNWEYNDVRVNFLSFCLQSIFRQSLEEVFAERIMRRIGASSEWSWKGYINSDAIVDGRLIRGVPGGGHWGGGIFISATDMARIAQMVASGGLWHGVEIVPKAYIDEMVRPCAIKDTYGLMWWLNTRRVRFAKASEMSYFALGTGGNVTWIDPERDFVGIFRWIDTGYLNDFFEVVYDILP